MPFVQVCGVYQRLRRERELGDRPAAEHAAGQHERRLVVVERVGLDRRHQLANVRVISPPAMRTPVPDARRAARPARSVPASVSSSHRTSYSASWTAISRGRDRIERRRGVARPSASPG
jgi:hypothetical protein